MSKESELWQFVASRLKKNESVMLLIVAESSGSSPGRAGYKMAIGEDGELCGSIGGGVMEVNLVEQSRQLLSEPGVITTAFRKATIIEQVHQKNASHSSGMICSGKQTIIIKRLEPDDLETIQQIIECLTKGKPQVFEISDSRFQIIEDTENELAITFIKKSENSFVYRERLGPKHTLFIIGGGHCALALSELMSRMDFRISIFDDRPELNTLAKNQFADGITIIERYENIAQFIPSGIDTYVVVMTLGFKSDEIVIRSLFDKEFRYFGVLGSKAKMKTLLNTLEKDGFSKERLLQIHTPIGISINSRTPEEIAVSIAAEIISIKNS
ncbi:MAG: XdhC family protein [Chloracidobacterium sp.]|nr:XdhC family protein [Chloracidobacterium sp.]